MPPQGDGFGGGGTSLIGDPARFGLWLFLGTVSMLFIGFTSAYILRRASADWQPLDRSAASSGSTPPSSS